MTTTPKPPITHYVRIRRGNLEFRLPAYTRRAHLFSSVDADLGDGPIRAGDHLAARTSSGWQRFDHVTKKWVDVDVVSY